MRIKPKKSLGQNFLTDQNIQHKIIESLELRPDDSVLEIGPGRGELTRIIGQRVSRVYAIEIDRRLCAVLKDGLAGHKNIRIINRDILKLNLAEELKPQAKLKVFGNIPYYITSPIIEYLLKHKDLISRVFLTLQKEFARRITASPGSKEYGSFTCFVQYHSEPKILFSIKKNSFFPAPKVDSCFLRLEIRQKPPVAVNDEELLFKLIRQAFGKRRKTLRNSLKTLIGEEKIDSYFIRHNINPAIRPEQLSLQDFAKLANT